MTVAGKYHLTCSRSVYGRTTTAVIGGWNSGCYCGMAARIDRTSIKSLSMLYITSHFGIGERLEHSLYKDVAAYVV